MIADIDCGDRVTLSGYDSSEVCYVLTSQGVKLVFDDGNTILLNGIDEYDLCYINFDFV